MAEFVVRIGQATQQGVRARNEDRLFADAAQGVYLVADGMGGQLSGDLASTLAAQVIPSALRDRLAAHDAPRDALQRAILQAHQTILDSARDQPEGRKMGTTAVVALQMNGAVYVTGVGDSRAYLIRGEHVEQLTIDHSVAYALERNGTFTPEEAAASPLRHYLYLFLGCNDMPDSFDVHLVNPQPGDRLVLASDGVTNHLTDDDLRASAWGATTPQQWAEHLVQLALDRHSRDNVTCVVVAFDRE
jgi:protein phosphatase